MIKALGMCLIAIALLVPSLSFAANIVKLGLIEPLSGTFANLGEDTVHNFEFLIEKLNAKGGVLNDKKLALATFDNKHSTQESLIALKRAIDLGIRVIFQASGSHNAHAFSEAVAKHNTRNPERSILYLNFGATDTTLTNEKCSFWHFRFDANIDMKLAAMTTYMAGQKNIRKVFLINQDYAAGQTVSRVEGAARRKAS